jgi:hypothetical protein
MPSGEITRVNDGAVQADATNIREFDLANQLNLFEFKARLIKSPGPAIAALTPE